ncbi:MAG: hypothetical protein KAT34_09375 [Candidatus Aminicenantes bacterium]|nr:hypothetical protein [Candidatus Aminicenantes bacterium]
MTDKVKHVKPLVRIQLLTLISIVFFLSISLPLAGQVKVDEKLFKEFTYRNLGPFRAGAWIGDIAVPENPGPEHKYTFYVAARNGGVWKTVNNGTTFTPVFDNYGVNAIGAVEVAPSNPDIVWVGTGEDSNARSSYSGNGIYKSLDGGKNFVNMGLKDSHHIGRILIHPKNPDIVYVAVMGHLFSYNEERGVFKTGDGGKTWEKILYIDKKIGVVDLCMNFKNPDILFAATYDKHRYPWHYEAGGEHSRIYRTTDGGKNWNMLTRGLPDGNLGRIGVDIHRANPQIVYAVIQNLNPKPDLKKKSEKKFDAFTDHSYDDLVGGEVYRSDDGGDTWRKVSKPGVNVSGKAAYSFNEITVDPQNPDNVYIVAVQMLYSHDGGKTWPGWKDWQERERFIWNFGDVRTFRIDPADPQHMMLGSDGGIYISYDAGKTTFHLYNIPLGEIYDVEVDNEEPYNIYAGLQDHETWKGPSNGWSGSVGVEDWVISGMWDGMYTVVNPENNRWLYFTTQFGKHHRVDQLMGERTEIEPKAPEGKPPYRYTWKTPIVLSPHNGDIVYTGGQMLLRSLDRGDNWEELSPDLTYNDPVKIAGKGHIMFCTITTISESPKKAGVIWVGTDGGRVHLTKDHGAHWQELTKGITGVGGPVNTWVSRVLASNHDAGTAYVTKSGYREDVFKPFIYRTKDFGQSWEDISGNLPGAPISVVFEDNLNPDLLFVGNDKGVYFTLNSGSRWIPLKNNMPPVPVRDLLIHPREKDLVVGTYGRGVWVTNIAPLQELSDEILQKDFYLFDIVAKPVNNRSQRARWGNYHMTGDAHIRTPNETPGLTIFYYLKKKMADTFTLIVTDLEGKEIARPKINREPGIHRITWNSPERKPGTFRFILKARKKQVSKKGTLKPRLIWPVGNPDHLRGITTKGGILLWHYCLNQKSSICRIN